MLDDIVHIQQPPASRMCGQAVVAMVLRTTLKEACRRIGHGHGTRTKELLRVLGPICVDGKLIVLRKREMPEYAILKLVEVGREGRSWHWVLRKGTEIYDPALPTRVSFEAWHDVRCVRRGRRVTSALRLQSPQSVLGS